MGFIRVLTFFVLSIQPFCLETNKVYFYGWGGSQHVNDYMTWAAQELSSKHGIDLVFVKVADVSEVVNRLLSDKTMNRQGNGNADVIWINGENFYTLKSNGLLYGPILNQLTHFSLLNQHLPIHTDFTIPTDGYEVPWGVGQFTILHNNKTTPNPPKSTADFFEYLEKHPDAVTLPKPPDFMGTSWLKQLMLDQFTDHSVFELPVTTEAFATTGKIILEQLFQRRFKLYRQGRVFPSSSGEQLQLFDDGVLDLAFTFNPNEIYALKRENRVTEDTNAYQFTRGALTNCHFLAIPFNSSKKEQAHLVIDFLLSPKAQAYKADTRIWGDPTVLDISKLTEAEQAEFIVTPLGSVVAEPHPSWTEALEAEFLRRFYQ